MENVTTLATTQTRALASPLQFSPDQEKMIRDSFANGASPQEFAVLMEVAKARRLNPLLRQIYFVKRWDSQKRCEVWSTQISIDGLRAVAERTGLYAGQDEPEYEHDPKTNALKCCKVRVYRKDWPRPAVGVAYFEEYAQTKKDGGYTQFWQGKPHVMLAKCAEALGIRKAFPEDTGGLYVKEEMGQDAEDAAFARSLPAPQPPIERHDDMQRRAQSIVDQVESAQPPLPQRHDARVVYRRLTTGRTKETYSAIVQQAIGRVPAKFDLTQDELALLVAELDRLEKTGPEDVPDPDTYREPGVD